MGQPHQVHLNKILLLDRCHFCKHEWTRSQQNKNRFYFDVPTCEACKLWYKKRCMDELTGAVFKCGKGGKFPFFLHISIWNCCATFVVFRYSTKDYCIQQEKPQLAANQPKNPHLTPPPPPRETSFDIAQVMQRKFFRPIFTHQRIHFMHH